MIEDEKDIQEFEKWFNNRSSEINVNFYYLSLKQSWLVSRKELREENERLRVLSIKQDEYLKLLADEISDLVGLASVHGWKSIRYERGEKFRKEIACLRDESPNAGYKSLREV